MVFGEMTLRSIRSSSGRNISNSNVCYVWVGRILFDYCKNYNNCLERCNESFKWYMIKNTQSQFSISFLISEAHAKVIPTFIR